MSRLMNHQSTNHVKNVRNIIRKLLKKKKKVYHLIVISFKIEPQFYLLTQYVITTN